MPGKDQDVSVEWLAERLQDRTMRGIALETSALIRAGVLPVGSKLPPVRDLARVLGVSPATVSSAWSELRRHKAITGRGRGGVWVSGDKVAPRPSRFESVGNFGDGIIDLTAAVPDPALLPPLEAALRHAASSADLNNYRRDPILPALRAAMEARWPYEAEAFVATNGGYNAVYTTLQALIMPGSAVAIEDPTGMRLLDILEDRGAHILPVDCDDEGPLPASLAAALAKKPAAFIFQPRTHAITGRQVSPARLEALAAVLKTSEALIIEDDGVGDLSSSPPISLGRHFPDRVVHILSFSKSLGPDLRLAVLSGSALLVEQIQAYRSFSAGWTSRLLQAAAAFLLADPQSIALVETARITYEARRRKLRGLLEARGIPLPDLDGMALWIPVREEQFALITLAARGIAVLPGTKCSLRKVRHIRVATSILADREEAVADAIALARPGRAWEGGRHEAAGD